MREALPVLFIPGDTVVFDHVWNQVCVTEHPMVPNPVTVRLAYPLVRELAAGINTDPILVPEPPTKRTWDTTSPLPVKEVRV